MLNSMHFGFKIEEQKPSKFSNAVDGGCNCIYMQYIILRKNNETNMNFTIRGSQHVYTQNITSSWNEK